MLAYSLCMCNLSVTLRGLACTSSYTVVDDIKAHAACHADLLRSLRGRSMYEWLQACTRDMLGWPNPFQNETTQTRKNDETVTRQNGIPPLLKVRGGVFAHPFKVREGGFTHPSKVRKRGFTHPSKSGKRVHRPSPAPRLGARAVIRRCG